MQGCIRGGSAQNSVIENIEKCTYRLTLGNPLPANFFGLNYDLDIIKLNLGTHL